MFIHHNKVRMHDTDMAGILYFARQFRFVHDALEDFMHNEGISFDQLFHESSFIFVIAHAEADYLAPVIVGDELEVHLEVENVGNTSFTMKYKIFKPDHVLMGTAKTVHVCLDPKTRKKIPVPDHLRVILAKHMLESSTQGRGDAETQNK